MSKKGYLVGEVSKITGISKQTLRFYDKIGLLKPKHVDSDNHYRYDTPDQFWRIDTFAEQGHTRFSKRILDDFGVILP